MIERIKSNIVLCILLLSSSISVLYCQTIPLGYRSLSPMPVEMGNALLNSLSDNERVDYQKFATTKSNNLTIVDQLHFLHEMLKNRMATNYQRTLTDMMVEISRNASSFSIKDLNQQMDNAGFQFQDSLAIISDLLIKASEFDFLSKRNKLFPSKNSIDAQLFYMLSPNQHRSKFLNHIYLSLNNATEQVSLYNELFSDFLGPVRMSFGALISNETRESDSFKISNDVVQSNAMQRLLGGGGNGVVTFSLPLYYFGNENLSNGVRMSFAPKFSFDIPNLGSQTSSVVKNMDLAIEINVYIVGHNDIISVFINNRFGRLYGSNEFYQNLSSDGSFFLNQCTFGFSISSNFVLSYNWFYSSDPILDNAMDSFISFSVIPSL